MAGAERDLTGDIREVFPKAEIARVYLAKQNILLEEGYGFTPNNTQFAEGGCSDEINEPEYRFMEHCWKGRFKFGGLAGYCHGGRSALSAVSHHAPEAKGKKNLLLLAGAHIGYHRGEWGKVLRPGQREATACCGSLSGIVGAGYEALSRRSPDSLDRQQGVVEQIMLPYLEECFKRGTSPDMVEATNHLMGDIDRDLSLILRDLEERFDGRIAVITGITINTEAGNFFSPSRSDVLGRVPS